MFRVWPHHSPARSHAALVVSAFILALAASMPAAPATAQAPAAAQEPLPYARTAASDEVGQEALAGEAEPSDMAERMRDLEQLVVDGQRAAELRRPTVVIGGAIDIGFFAVQGNGSGVVQDRGSTAYPEYAGQYGWVFLGDILAPAVNSRGEPADLGNLPGVDRQDTIASRGAPGFLVNEVNFTVQAAVGSTALAIASVNFLPRTGHDFRLGDVFDVDIAQVAWMPGGSRRWTLFAGKMDSLVGIEYRDRKARDRFGVTPSLIARYTTGTPIGMKARGKLGADDWLIVAGALTNGSSTTETFHFYDEVDSNLGKTASGRIALAPWNGAVELGLSGAYGPQDHAQDSADAMWFAGIDLMAHRGGFDLKAQWLTGRAPGERADRVYESNHRPFGLRLNGGAYLEADWMVTPAFGLLGRGEYRDALVWLGNPAAPGGGDRLYITKSWRATGGLRIVPSEHAAVKLEYLHNGEYGRVPQIRDDVLVSSLVLSY